MSTILKKILAKQFSKNHAIIFYQLDLRKDV